MHVLFTTERYPPSIGGVAASAGRISRTIAALGHSVDVFVFARELPAGMVQSDQVSDRLTVHRLGIAKSMDFAFQQALTFLDWLRARKEFDLVWGHYLTHAGFLAVWVAQTWETTSVLSVRGNDLDKQLFPPGDFARLKWCLEQCTGVLTVSHDLARKVRRLTERPVAVLPNSVDIETFRPGPRPEELAAKYAICPGELVLGFNGELRAKKGIGFLLHAFRETCRRQLARLLVIGDIRPDDRGEWERTMVAEEDLRQGVIVTGHLEDPAEVARHLRLLDVMLLPSLWEGMPNSLLEAMASGIPVIASDAGAIPELLIDHQTGFLVPRTHLHLLSERIMELLALPGETRRAIVGAARQHVRDYYSPDAESRRLAAILKEFAGVRRET